MNYKKFKLFLILIIISAPGILYADISMQNVSGREKQSLNGVWNILIDAYDEGLKKNGISLEIQIMVDLMSFATREILH